jgi:hypothetical protein
MISPTLNQLHFVHTLFSYSGIAPEDRTASRIVMALSPSLWLIALCVVHRSCIVASNSTVDEGDSFLLSLRIQGLDTETTEDGMYNLYHYKHVYL